MIGALVVVQVPPELLEDVSPALRSLALSVPSSQIAHRPFFEPIGLADLPASHKITKKINKIYNLASAHLHSLALIAIDLYVMSNIEQDLLHSQNQILTLLKEYEKSSEDIIASNCTAQLVSVLQAIASLDHQRLQLCESTCRDPLAQQHIRTISQNLQKAAEQHMTQLKPEQKKTEEVKREPKIAQKKEEKTGSGILDFVKSKFTSKEKKATEMIFPDKEPQCKYDPKTRSWIFEGEEPEAPKVIPKPPSAAEKKAKEEVRKEEEGEIGQLTAPPAFKRKSTAPTQKAKAKIREEKELPKIDEPITYARVVEMVSQSFTQILQKVRSGVYEINRPQDPQHFAQFMSIAEKTFQVNEEIQGLESKVIEKWSKILTSQNRQLKIMERVIKQMGESASTYSIALSKLGQPSKIRETAAQPGSAQSVEDFQEQKEQLKNAQEYIFELKARIIRMLEEKDKILETDGFKEKLKEMEENIRERQNLISVLEGKNSQLSSLGYQAEQQLIKYKQLSAQKDQKIKGLEQEVKRLSEYNKEQKSLHLIYLDRIEKTEARVKALQKQNSQLGKANADLDYQAKILKAKVLSINEKAVPELAKQKKKVEQQLKAYEQKEKIYLATLKNFQEHQNIMHEYESALSQETQLLNTILQKRLQITKNPQSQEHFFKKHQETTSHSLILQLSDIVNSITETHLDRLDSFSRSYSRLHKKYTESKELANKIKSSASTQNMSLHRNVTRLKSLLEIEKNAKEESQERCSQVQLECDKLKKKLAQYKEEDQFNKSYLSKLKNSKINSQNESVLSLQEDNEQLATEIEYLHREIQQKAEALRKNQNDLEDLLANYEKNQVRLLETERKHKESQREMKALRQSLEEEVSRNQMYEIKLQHQKERYDQIQGREEARLKSIEANFQKKMKILKNEIEQASKREEQLQSDISSLERDLSDRESIWKQSKLAFENQLNRLERQHQKEMHDITVLLDETNQELIASKDKEGHLQRENEQLRVKEQQLHGKLTEIVDQHLKDISIQQRSQENLQNIITALIQKHNSLEEESTSFQNEYHEKIAALQLQLHQSTEAQQTLLEMLRQDSEVIRQLGLKITSIQTNQSSEHTLQQLAKESEQLKELIDSLSADLQAKTNQRNELQEIIEKMSEDMARLLSNSEEANKAKTDLEEKLMFKEREIQTLANQNNAKTEELMIKTEELLEKDRVMLERQEASVMKKEEFDELANQMHKLRQELASKDERIAELQADLQLMAGELEQHEGVDTETFQKETGYLKQIIQLKDQQIKILLEEMDSLKDQTNRLSSQLQASIATMNQQIAQRQESITDLTSKLAEKQEEVELLVEQLQSAENEIKKEMNEGDDAESQMKELVSEIESLKKQLEISNQKLALNEKQFKEVNEFKDCLKNAYDEMVKGLSFRQAKIQELTNKDYKREQQNKRLESEVSQLLTQVGSLEKEKIELVELVETLQSQLQLAREAKQTQVDNVQSQTKEQGKVIESLKSDIRSKEELLLQKQRQIEAKDKAITKISAENKMQQDELKELKKTCLEKGKHLTEAQIAEQEKTRIIVEMEKTIKEYEEKCNDLETSLAEMAEIMDKQENTIQDIKNSSRGNDEAEIKELRSILNDRNTEISDCKKKIQEITRKVTEKEGEYQKKIESLEREIIGLNSLKSANKRLEEGLKGLQQENRTLLNEKIELIKSNNYLVSINQKLVQDKSPHNIKESKAEPQAKPQLDAKTEQKQPPASESKDPKTEPKGFLGAISSLFLTPTETDRLRK